MDFSKAVVRLSDPKNRKLAVYQTTVHGGVSTGPYEGFNLAFHVGDDRIAVEKNRSFLTEQIGTDNILFMNQTHSSEAALVKEVIPQGTDIDADAIITDVKGYALAVMTADCVPVILADAAGRLIAAVHCGWRGTYSGILEKTAAMMRSEVPDTELTAYIGPAIGASSYEVGEDLKLKFEALDSSFAECFAHLGRGKFLFDLKGVIKKKLKALNAALENTDSPDTFTDGNFYSYRRNKITGRQATVAVLSR